jgi:hypothetical protein
MVLDKRGIYLKANGIDLDRGWLKILLPNLFGQHDKQISTMNDKAVSAAVKGKKPFQ